MVFKPCTAGLRSTPTFAICTVTIAIFVDLFLYSLVIPILPQILENQVGVASADVQLNLSGLLAAYNAAVVVFAPISGFLADKWSNRKILLIGGLFALAGATVLFMLSKTVALLYIARILQGTSAAIVWAVGLALLVDVVGPQGIGAAMGWTSLGLSLGNTVGPLVGGVVYQHAGRYATFSVAFGAIGVDVLLRLLLIEPQKRTQQSTIPEGTPAASRDLEITLVTLPESTREDDKSSSERPSRTAYPSPTAQRNTKSPAIITILKHRDMLSGLWCVFLATIVLTGLEAALPLHVEKTFGWSSQGAGLIFLSIVLPIFLSPVIGMLYDRHGPNLLSATGFALVVIAGPLLTVVRLHSIGLIVCLVFLLILVGLGVSLVMTPQMAEIGIFADKKAEADPSLFGAKGATAQCCALMTVATAVAGVVGPLITGAVQASSGWTATSVTLGAFAATGCASLVVNAWWQKRTVSAGNPERTASP